MSAIDPPKGMFKALATAPQQDARQYWMFQIAGWSAMALLSYLSLTVWYNPGQWNPVLHTLLQSMLGLLVSHPLRWVASWSWNFSLWRRVGINSAAVLAATIVWTLLRIYTFTWLTGEPIPISDWGGWIFASVIVFGAWEFCYHALKYYRHWNTEHQLAVEAQNTALRANEVAQRETLRRLEAEKLFRDAQLRMLKYQLNPHFLFNALNSVSSLVRRGDGAGATDMLAQIGDFLRLTLESSDEVQHTLDEELKALELYLGIEKVRFGNRLQTVFNVDPDARDVAVPSLLLQPLFENSVKFAVGRSMNPTTISLDVHLDDDRLHVSVRDDGPGMDDREGNQSAEGQGIGLLNVRQRLSSVHGENFTMEYGDGEPQGFRVELSFPARAPDGR